MAKTTEQQSAQQQTPSEIFWNSAKNDVGTVWDGVKSATSYVVQGGADWATGANPQPVDGDPNSLLQSRYDFNYLVFPSDLGMSYYGHYMIININIPTKGYSFGDGQVRDPAGIVGPAFSDKLNNLSTVDNLRYRVTPFRDPVSGQEAPRGIGLTGGKFLGARQTRRIAESIAVFMPSGLNFLSTNEYDNVSIVDRFGYAAIGDSINTFAKIGQMGRAPINPGVEVYFTNTQLRTFIFEFLFSPKNEQESINLESIIRTLRFHGSPEIHPGVTGYGILGGLNWIPPAEFDFMFMHRGAENRNMPRINTCVLRAIETDYNPDIGMFSTFSNGHPVQVRMRLEFQEVEPVHKLRVTQGYY